MVDEAAIGERYRALAGELDERRRRLWAAAEARSHGRGGIAAVARASGIAENTIRAGLRELASGESLEPGRVRRRGGGRKPLRETDPTLVSDLEGLVDADSRGDPEQPLRWTAKSVRKLAVALRELGHPVSHETVARLLRSLGYSLQANAKVREGASHPDRDAQFRHINDTVAKAIAAGEPAISVDTKKKELVGDFKAGGRELRPQGSPLPVRVHDFRDPELGKAIPYGVYDLAANEGFVSVGVDHDTPVFAVTSIEAWWSRVGAKRYPEAREIFITAGAGGSNSYRSHVWKHQLQRVADKLDMSINWRGHPLRTYETVINLIGNTTNRGGLVVRVRLDRRRYPTGKKISKKELRELKIEREEFHGEWNYVIRSRMEQG